MEQHPGQVVITPPYAYHCGFSRGWAINEAVNVTTMTSLEYNAKEVHRCSCGDDQTPVTMKRFNQALFPEEALELGTKLRMGGRCLKFSVDKKTKEFVFGTETEEVRDRKFL